LAILRKSEFLDNSSTDEMFLDDPFKDFRPAGMVPDRFWIHDRDGPLQANPQTVCLGSIDQWLRTHQVQLFEPALQIFPGFQHVRFRATFGLSLIGAQENVAPVLFESERLRNGGKVSANPTTLLFQEPQFWFPFVFF